jgi:hypothetical protein
MSGYVHALEGKRNQARKIIKSIKSLETEDCKQNVKLARIYLALGEKETAYEFLEQAFNNHEFDLVALKIDPRFASIRHEPRFKVLVALVGLPVSQ